MIYLHTGRPGSGKTLAAVERGLSWLKEGRRVFVFGLAECDFEKTGFLQYEGDLSQWAEKLGPRDVLIVDEVQRWLPKGMTFRHVPDWVERLTRNRHHGIDFLWTTQDARNIDAFVRRLVNEHRDYVAHWSNTKAKVYTWPIGVEEPEKPTERKRADVRKWPYPKELFGLYKSAEVHTGVAVVPHKIKLLKRSLFVAAVCLLLGGLAVKFWFWDKARASSQAHVASADTGGLLNGLVGPAGRPGRALTTEEWLDRQKPRVDGLLWTAPLYDDRKPVSEPETYCMAMQPKRCSCITEQGTKLTVRYDLCMSMVQNGVYNPYRKPSRERVELQGRRGDDYAVSSHSVDSRLVDRSLGLSGAPSPQGSTSASIGSNALQVPQAQARMDSARW